MSSLKRSKLIFSVFFTATEPREQKPSGRCTPLFPQYDSVGARMETFKNGHCLLKLCRRPGFSTRVNISPYSVLGTCNNNSSKCLLTLFFSVTGRGCYVSCFHYGLTFENVKGSGCIFTKHFEYNPDCIHLLQSAPKFVIDK